MLVAPLSVQNVFEHNIHHEVPLFQRPYVWKREEQWQPLWDDLRRLAEHIQAGHTPRAHFLGATVQEKRPTAPGHIEARLLVDGQQRLTTLQLLLQAFEDHLTAPEQDLYRQAVRNLTRNNHPLITSVQERFKVWPTNADRAHFRRTMEAGSPEALRKAYQKRADASDMEHPIPNAYLFFHGAIGDWLAEDGADTGARVRALYAAIRDNVRLVVIDLDDHDDAQLIFETLNARGTPLLASDLVKNLLLQEAEAANADAEDLYERYWRPFDEDASYWRTEIGKGHARRPRIEGYLQNLLTLRLREEVQASHLYAAYRDYSHAPVAGLVQDRLAELARYASTYRRLDGTDAPPRVRLFLERLATMDVGTAYPFLLELFQRLDMDSDALAAVLEDVESFLVRRMVCRLSTRGYNVLFIGLLAALQGDAAGIPAAVRGALLSGTAEVNRWPDDREFHTAWAGNPLYDNLTRPRLRLLLEGLERKLRGSKLSETDDVPRYLTVEHILPRSWEMHWPLPPDQPTDIATDARNRAKHTIGNLTLLSERLNPSISNGPWRDTNGHKGKRSALASHSVLHLNHQVCAEEDWNEETIAARVDALFDLTRAIWGRPHG